MIIDITCTKQIGLALIYINEHIKTLIRKRKQYIVYDDYNIEDRTKWNTEKMVFLNKVVNIKKDEEDYNLLLEYIDKSLDKKEKFLEKELTKFDISMDGWEYERYCAELLELNKWHTTVTKGSGDQGVDIIAKRNGLVVVFQCKKYNSPVNNKAVQEIFTAKKHVEANYAIVVTNSTFTKSAIELANTTNVKLIHHDEIEKLTELLNIRE